MRLRNKCEYLQLSSSNKLLPDYNHYISDFRSEKAFRKKSFEILQNRNKVVTVPRFLFLLFYDILDLTNVDVMKSTSVNQVVFSHSFWSNRNVALMMKAVVIDKYGGNEVVNIMDVSLPAPGRNDVLVKVRAASVNPVDWKIRSGMTKILTGRTFPKILGSECAGKIAGTGAGVTRFQRGDQVVVFPGIRRLGAFAEYVIAAEQNTFLKPHNITFEQASGIPVAGITALQALRDLGHIESGKNVLINGSSGGVGHFAIQIAKLFGARVTAVCSGSNSDFVTDLGADRTIDYVREDFTKGEERYDIIFDAVTKHTFGECKRVLTPMGVYVNTLPTFSVLLNQYVLGFLTGLKAACVMVRPNATDMEWMKAQIEGNRIRIVVDRVYPLENIQEAFAYSETEKARGKIIMKVSTDD
jgi:NADPH:quinone reductase-like Zn-dependent oxidoreductase